MQQQVTALGNAQLCCQFLRTISRSLTTGKRLHQLVLADEAQLPSAATLCAELGPYLYITMAFLRLLLAAMLAEDALNEVQIVEFLRQFQRQSEVHITTRAKEVLERGLSMRALNDVVFAVLVFSNLKQLQPNLTQVCHGFQEKVASSIKHALDVPSLMKETEGF